MAVRKTRILWTDDEIDLLKPHILFLENRGYDVTTASNGDDALILVKSTVFDLIFLDENMPGLSGLQVLSKIKADYPNIPVVMVTKNEEEDIMDAAIGSKISDYLIKPVNPKQVLLTIKKNLDNKRLISKETTTAYQSEFGQLGSQILMANTFEDWVTIYKKLVFWEIEFESSGDDNMAEILKTQKAEANMGFCKYITKHYLTWFDNDNDGPLISPNIMKTKVFPWLEKGEKVVLVVMDNLRLDQWYTIQPLISEHLQLLDNDVYCSILPTATQYSRNAIFAGLMPHEIKSMHPDLWLDDIDEGSKNMNEEELLRRHLNRIGKKYKLSYTKVLNQKVGKKLNENLSNILQNDLIVIVYNFVDMLSHARTEMEMIRELANNEDAYRSLTQSWFAHSSLLELFKLLAEKGAKIVLTTDHGSINVSNPVKVVGDKKTTSNLRYKQGKNLGFSKKEVFHLAKPQDAHLPVPNLSSTYIFAQNADYLVYPNNYNYYANYYKNTFQHGGISMEEMLIPVVTLNSK